MITRTRTAVVMLERRADGVGGQAQGQINSKHPYHPKPKPQETCPICGSTTNAISTSTLSSPMSKKSSLTLTRDEQLGLLHKYLGLRVNPNSEGGVCCTMCIKSLEQLTSLTRDVAKLELAIKEIVDLLKSKVDVRTSGCGLNNRKRASSSSSLSNSSHNGLTRSRIGKLKQNQDSYHRTAEDVKLEAEAGNNVLRLAQNIFDPDMMEQQDECEREMVEQEAPAELLLKLEETSSDEDLRRRRGRVSRDPLQLDIQEYLSETDLRTSPLPNELEPIAPLPMCPASSEIWECFTTNTDPPNSVSSLDNTHQNISLNFGHIDPGTDNSPAYYPVNVGSSNIPHFAPGIETGLSSAETPREVPHALLDPLCTIPRFVPGIEAVCHHCGTRSRDLNHCEYCGTVLTHGALKLVPCQNRSSHLQSPYATVVPEAELFHPPVTPPEVTQLTSRVNTHQSQTPPTTVVVVECQGISIGSYKCVIPRHHILNVVFSKMGIRFSLPPWNDRHHRTNFHIGEDDVLRIDVNTTLPTIFITTGERGTEMIRRLMRFSHDPTNPNFHYDPARGDQRQKRITLHLLRLLDHEDIGQLRKLFGRGTLTEMNFIKTNEVLLKITSLSN